MGEYWVLMRPGGRLCNMLVVNLFRSLLRLQAGLRPAVAGVVVVAAAVAATVLSVGPSRAQADIGTFSIVENGAQVGEIYVPWRAMGAVNYVEDWVLWPGYVYPGDPAHPGVSFTVGPSSDVYRDEADFFAHVPYPAGSKYVKVLSQESASMPGR